MIAASTVFIVAVSHEFPERTLLARLGSARLGSVLCCIALHSSVLLVLCVCLFVCVGYHSYVFGFLDSTTDRCDVVQQV